MSAAGPPTAWRRVAGGPAATALLGASSLLVAAWPRLAEAAQLDRALVARQPWRILTGHVAHFSGTHLAYDLVVLLALGWVCETRWPARTRASLGLAMLACSAAVLLGAPGLDTYRGLSGLDSALFVLLAARLGAERGSPALPVLAGLALLAKTGYELRTDVALFAGADRFVPVPIAHVAGAAVGLLLGLLPQLPERPTSSSHGTSSAAHSAFPCGVRCTPSTNTRSSSGW